MKSTTFEDFISNSKDKHENIYDYSMITKDDIVNFGSKVNIICKNHGIFEQAVGNHLSGAGCTSCGIENANLAKQRKYSEEFKKKANEIFGDLYDYSKVIYVSSKQYIIIVCKKHGDFKMKPYAHITNKSNCPECAIEIRGEKKSCGHDDFIEKCKNYWGVDRFDYSKTNYNTNRDKICVKCKQHNKEFIQLASAHLRGQHGCDLCSIDAKELKRQEQMNEIFERLWSLFQNDTEIYIHKESCFVNGTSLGKSLGKKGIFSWISDNKNKIDSIKAKLKCDIDLVQKILVGSNITLIHPYLALVYSRTFKIYEEIVVWLNNVSKTCPTIRKYLEDACEIDETLKTDLTKLKFFEEEKVDYIIDTSKYKLILNDMIITARPEDGFINATQLCKAGGKKFSHWSSLESTKKLIEALKQDQESVTGIPATNFMEIIQGGEAKLQGSWIHQDLAIHLAMWISPEFSIQVSKWIREIIYTGKVDIQQKKNESELLKLQNAFSKQLIENKKLQKKVVCRMEREKFASGFYIYIAQTDTTKITRRYKIGKTKNLEETLASYNRLEPTEYVFYMDCNSEHMMDSTETFVHSCLSKNRDYANHEYFILPEDKEITFFIRIIQNIINAGNSSSENGNICDLAL